MKTNFTRTLAALVGVIGSLTVFGVPSAAQQGLRPSDEKLESPALSEDQGTPNLDLPEPATLSPEERQRLSGGQVGFVSLIVVEGSSVFSSQELSALMAPYEGRLLGSEQLFAARDAISKLYHDAGYLTSGAILPDQDVSDGVVSIQVVEGRLSEIQINGTHSFHKSYFQTRIRWAARTPVNVFRIERALQLLQQDALITRVSANLLPGEVRGESRLELDVQEAFGARLDVAAANDRPPSVGEFAGEFHGELPNVYGIGDRFSVDYRVAEGLEDYGLAYRVPVNRFDTTLSVGYRDSRGEVVLDAFSRIDIRSKSQTWSVGIEQPLFRDYGREIRIGLVGNLRKSETRVNDRFFCTITGDSGDFQVSSDPAFAVFGRLDCDQRIAALRFFQLLSLSGQRSAFALRSTLTVGFNAFGATRNPNTVADGRFYAWLGQAQFVHRLPHSLFDIQIVARLDAQLASDALLSIEKFSLGGARTVRGYRENQLVRDNGVAASLELRIPVIRGSSKPLSLLFVPFVDFGRAWDEQGPGQQESDTLVSLGAGIQFQIYKALKGEFYYGGRLTGVSGDNGNGIQRKGLHFRIVLDMLAYWR